jgi:hypothetical protein
MRRSYLSWLLSLLLVLVQHGAVLHELGHLSHIEPSAGTTVHVDLQSLDRGITSDPRSLLRGRRR